MNYITEYKKWLNSDAVDAEDKNKLKEIENNEAEIKESFYQTLAFGTAGLRGVIGVGTNRMNKYVVRRATQGIANYISKNGEELKSVTIPSSDEWTYISISDVEILDYALPMIETESGMVS